MREKLVEDLVDLLKRLRDDLRRKGDYKLSDNIRMKLKEFGVIIEDTPEGSKWKLA